MRALSRRRTAWIALAAVLAVSAGALLTWRLTNVFGPDRLCGGAVSRADAQQVLGEGRITESGSTARAGDPTVSCTITARTGLGGTARARVTLRTERAVSPGIDKQVRTVPQMSQLEGGRPGSFSNRTGWVLLPAGCVLPVPKDDPLPLKSRGDADVLWADVWFSPDDVLPEKRRAEEQPDTAARTALARVADGMAAAAGRQAGCGTPAAPAGDRLGDPGGQARASEDGKACGLPGLSLGSTAGRTTPLRERVSSEGAPVWICGVEDGHLVSPVLSFTVTADQAWIGAAALDTELRAALPTGWRGTGDTDGPVLVPCGKDTLYLGVSALDSALRDGQGEARSELPKDLFARFANAVAAQRGCEPIAPG
ncbi:hypothetical protein J2S46_005807 [Kitasatospora herbaricolor]|uniref:hypothetical protein n=1 Tax=Kitasatospora herbaricolor TaxID=68217 RepID=UPI00174B8217|nr:hypothetical protein [Kitasatospora herbaricolor]MDQ0311251.1 hypothetical protein [Kitasatospora herbaricolor]